MHLYNHEGCEVKIIISDTLTVVLSQLAATQCLTLCTLRLDDHHEEGKSK